MSSIDRVQKGNPHHLTIRQHVHSRACVARFTDSGGRIAVLRRDGESIFYARPTNDVFVAKRAWSHGLEHGLFYRVENRFQEAIDLALAGGDIDHEAVTEYAIVWAIRDNLNNVGRTPLKLRGITGDQLTKDQEEILEKKNAAYVCAGGAMRAHMSRYITVMQFFDMNRTALKENRWILGAAPGAMRIVCPDAYRSGNIIALPITPKYAFVASKKSGEPDEMTPSLVDRLNAKALADARSLVFGHPEDLPRVLATTSPI